MVSVEFGARAHGPGMRGRWGLWMSEANIVWAGFSPEQIRAELARLAQDLRSGKIKHADGESRDVRLVEWLEVWGKSGEEYFCMDIAIAVVNGSDCGSVACIGGHLLHRLGVQSSNDISHGVSHAPVELYSLFMPGVDEIDSHWDELTPEQAAQAIENWLEDPSSYPWRHVNCDAWVEAEAERRGC